MADQGWGWIRVGLGRVGLGPLLACFLLLLNAACSSSPAPSLGESVADAPVEHCWNRSSDEIRVIPPFERLWGESMGGRLIEGITQARGALFVTSLNRRCGAIDRETGRSLWRKKLPDQPLGAPEVGGGRIWITLGPKAPRILSLDIATGDVLGEWPIPTAVSSPIFRDSLIIVSTLRGQIMALSWERLDDEVSPDDLPLAWGHHVEGGLRARPMVLGDSLLLVGSLADSLHAFDLRTGDPAWSLGVSAPVYGLTPSKGTTHGPPGDDHVVFDADVSDADNFDADVFDAVVVTLYDGTVLAADALGSVLWTQSVEGPLLIPAAVGEGLVVTVSAGGVVTAFDPQRGTVWTASLQQAVEAPPVLSAEYAIVATRRGSLVGFQRQKGTRDWSLDFQGPVTVPPCVDPHRILVADGRGEIRAFAHAGAVLRPPSARTSEMKDEIPATASSDADTAWISVSSEPSGLGVLLDGRFVGWTPLDSLWISPGLHRIGLRDSSGWMAGEPQMEEWVRLASGDHRWLVLSPRGTVRIESVPPGATVTLDSEYLGTAPVLVTREPGSLVRLRHPGHRDTIVTVGDIESSSIVIRMKRDAADLDPGFTLSGERKRPWYTRPLVRWGAPLLTLASGAAAVLLRQEANDAYDDYLRTGEERARERHLSRAERKDRQSIISWVAAEVFFGFAFYSWIRSDEEEERQSDIPAPVARGDERGYR